MRHTSFTGNASAASSDAFHGVLPNQDFAAAVALAKDAKDAKDVRERLERLKPLKRVRSALTAHGLA